MKFLIRDDDTCAFTDPAELIRCYEGIWERVPVGLSTTPFRVAGGAARFPGQVGDAPERRPLADNPELVAFLREAGAARRVEVLLHGYEHTRPQGLPEYVSGSDLARKTREGRAYLEDLLGAPVGTFVPPYNGIMRRGFDAVVGAGLNLVAVPSLLRPSFRPVGPRSLVHALRVRRYRVLRGMTYPHVLRFPDHLEVAYHSVTPTRRLDGLLAALERCRAADGVFVAAIHYHAFGDRLASGETLGDALHALLDRAAGVPGVEFPTFAELWRDA